MEENSFMQGYPNVEYEKIEVKVTEAGQEISFSHTTEIDHTRIIGIAQVFSNVGAIPNSTIKLSVDSQEVFPTGFESKLIYAGQEVPPDERFVRYIDREAKQIKVEGTFKDGGALTPFVAYTANIYLRMLTNKS
jgi:hypothetical protein